MKISLKNVLHLFSKYDNGLLLCDLGGFDQILDLINSTTTDLDLKMQGLLVIGSAIQSNPKAKVQAAKSDLLKLLMNSLKSSSLSIDLKSNEHQSKLMFVLSALLRNFPYAQLKFVQLGGLDIFSNILKSDQSSHKIKVKVLTLVSDLVLEKRNALLEANADDKVKQYKE